LIDEIDKESNYRAKVILLKDEDYTVPEIRMTTNHHYANIRKWIHRFNGKGIEGIISRKHLHKPIKISDNMELSFVIKHLLTEIISNKD
jgi:transposase